MTRLASKYMDFGNYTLKLLRQIDPNGTMSTESRERFCEIMISVQRRLLTCMISRADSNRVKTIHSEDISSVLRFIMSPDLNRLCRSYILRSFSNIQSFPEDSTQSGVRKKRTTITERTKLLFTPSRIVTFVKRERPDIRVTQSGCVAVASILQCVAELILKEAITVKSEHRKQRLTRDHIDSAIKGNVMLNGLFE